AVDVGGVHLDVDGAGVGDRARLGDRSQGRRQRRRSDLGEGGRTGEEGRGADGDEQAGGRTHRRDSRDWRGRQITTRGGGGQPGGGRGALTPCHVRGGGLSGPTSPRAVRW